MMLMDHSRKFLKGVTLRVILLAIIGQYFLLTSVASNQIDIIFIPGDSAFTPEVKRRSNFFHLPVGLDANRWGRWNKYLSLLVIRRRVEEEYTILKGNGSCYIWQSKCSFLKSNYVYLALLIAVYYLLALRQVRKQTISQLFLTIICDLQPQLQSLSLLTIPKANIMINGQCDFVESTPIQKQLPSNNELILQFIEIICNKFIHIFSGLVILLRQKLLLILCFIIGLILVFCFLFLFLLDQTHQFFIPHTPLGQYQIINSEGNISCWRFKIIILKPIINNLQGLILLQHDVGHLRDSIQSLVGLGQGEALHQMRFEGYSQIVSLVMAENREQTLYLVCQCRFYLVGAGGKGQTPIELLPSFIKRKYYLFWQVSTLIRDDQITSQLIPHKLLNLMHFFFIIVFFPGILWAK